MRAAVFLHCRPHATGGALHVRMAEGGIAKRAASRDMWDVRWRRTPAEWSAKGVIYGVAPRGVDLAVAVVFDADDTVTVDTEAVALPLM
jgi:hypothetical protein